MIAAMDINNLIGKNGKLPWKLPNDLQHFKALTYGGTLLMGRKTYESLGKGLPNRTNFVLTSQKDYKTEQAITVHNAKEIQVWMGESISELFIIGGASLFAKSESKATKLYITRINHEFEGDIYFPEIDWDSWKLISSVKGLIDEKNAYPHTFEMYTKK